MEQTDNMMTVNDLTNTKLSNFNEPGKVDNTTPKTTQYSVKLKMLEEKMSNLEVKII